MSLKTSRDWIQKLEAESDLIAAMHLETFLRKDVNADLKTDAFNLANSDAHCNLIVRAITQLVTKNFSSEETARNLLRDLIEGQTYGAFAELAAYEWLIRCHVTIATQVRMTPSDVLGTQGSTLDGKIDEIGAYFDVKAFGFNGYLARRLKERLEAEVGNEQVLIEESWDLSIEIFEDLIRSAQTIAAELKQKRTLRKGRMNIRLEAKKPVTVSVRGVSPYRLAKENALYPFTDAKQFSRNSAFILIYLLHPWFNALSIHNDFAGMDTAFTRAFSRRAFMQFSTDSTALSSVADNVPPGATLADASRLLSAMFFVNAWPKEADPTITYTMPSWLYLNPRAAHPLSQDSVLLLDAQRPIYIDDFIDDDY
jgi:hypothetical protein